MVRFDLILIAGALSLTMTSCKQQEAVQDPETELAILEQLLASYREGVSRGDLELFMSIWAEDAVRLEDGINIIQGKDAIREHFRPFIEQMDCKITLYGEHKMEISGDMAYGYCNFILSASPKGSDSVSHTDFKFFEVYKRQADGRWLLQVGSASTNPTWTGDVYLEDILKEEDASVPRL